MGNERLSDRQMAIEKDLSPKDQLMEQVMKVINDNMDNEDLSVDMIAREVGLRLMRNGFMVIGLSSV